MRNEPVPLKPLDKKEKGDLSDISPPLGAFIYAENMTAYNKNLLGEILTMIDASMPKSDQREALKSLVKQSGWRHYDVVWRWMNDVLEDSKVAALFPYGNSRGASDPMPLEPMV